MGRGCARCRSLRLAVFLPTSHDPTKEHDQCHKGGECGRRRRRRSSFPASPPGGFMGGRGAQRGRAGRPFPAGDAAIATVSRRLREIWEDHHGNRQAPEEQMDRVPKMGCGEVGGGQSEEGSRPRKSLPAQLGCEFKRRPQPWPARGGWRRGRRLALSGGQSDKNSCLVVVHRASWERGGRLLPRLEARVRILPLPPAQSLGVSGEETMVGLRRGVSARSISAAGGVGGSQVSRSQEPPPL